MRARFAPSPTGALHLGGLRTALFNYLLARSTGGEFLLRIEDTDDARRVEGSVEDIVSVLEWCGIASDEAVRVQSEHLSSYSDAAQRLVERGQAYPCFCSADELAARRRADPHFMYDGHCASLAPEKAAQRVAEGETHTVRLNVRAALESAAHKCCVVTHDGPSTARRPALAVAFDDALRGRIEIPATSIDDQVLLKANGWPTYHLANTLDDRVQRVSHVLRGTEWLPSTPKHVLIHHALHDIECESDDGDGAGAERLACPTWVHLPLLVNAADRSKLSKRQGGAAAAELRTLGYLPSAVVNFVALLGWSGVDDSRASSLAHLEEKFELSKLNVTEGAVDFDRLKWLNQEHIAALSGAAAAAAAASDNALSGGAPLADRTVLHAQARPFLPRVAADASAEYVVDALALLGNRVATLAELDAEPGEGHAAPFFQPPCLTNAHTAKMGRAAWLCAKGEKPGSPEAAAESRDLAGAVKDALLARGTDDDALLESTVDEVGWRISSSSSCYSRGCVRLSHFPAHGRTLSVDVLPSLSPPPPSVCVCVCVLSLSLALSLSHQVLREVCAARGVKPGRVMQLTRYAVTGMKGGPAIGATLALLGRAAVVQRLDAALAFHAC